MMAGNWEDLCLFSNVDLHASYCDEVEVAYDKTSSEQVTPLSSTIPGALNRVQEQDVCLDVKECHEHYRPFAERKHSSRSWTDSSKAKRVSSAASFFR